MRRTLRTMGLASMLAMPNLQRTMAFAVMTIAVALAHSVAANGQDAVATHGGTLVKSAKAPFEVVITRDLIRIFPLTPSGKPVDTSRLTGKASFYHPNSPKQVWFSRDLQPTAAAAGQVSSSLDLTVGMGTFPPDGLNVAFEISGLADPAEPKAQFTVPVSMKVVAAPIYQARATKADDAAIAAQRTCRVSGQALGSMGAPIKMTRGGSATYLCCQSCVKKVQAAPDTFLPQAAVPIVNQEIKMEKATKADEAAITAQKLCKVSGEELTSMGGPLKLTLGGKSILVCCQSCIKDVKANPDKFFNDVTATKSDGGK